jgi:hypothetical protein
MEDGQHEFIRIWASRTTLAARDRCGAHRSAPAVVAVPPLCGEADPT